MALEIMNRNRNGTLEVRITDKFSGEDRKRLEAEIQRDSTEPGAGRLLVEFRDFDGFGPTGMWGDAKPADARFFDMARLALVGEKQWEAWMTQFCEPFIFSTIRYFTTAHTREARQWLEGHPPDTRAWTAGEPVAAGDCVVNKLSKKAVL
jgi:hypothetical protein